MPANRSGERIDHTGAPVCSSLNPGGGVPSGRHSPGGPPRGDGALPAHCSLEDIDRSDASSSAGGTLNSRGGTLSSRGSRGGDPAAAATAKCYSDPKV